MHRSPYISILLAAWFGLGGVFGPRFLCLCTDGTTTIEISQQFCCGSDSSSDAEGCGEEIAVELGEAFSNLESCLSGCDSTLLLEDVGVLVNNSTDELHEIGPPSHMAVSDMWGDAFVWTPFRLQAFGIPRGDDRCARGNLHLRSVILLV